jgi:hypothetical protein
MAGDMESLAGVTAGSMADEVIRNKARFDWSREAAALARAPLLVLTSDDGLAPAADRLAAAVRAAPSGRVTQVHVATDHPWSGARIRLEQEVIAWLEALR